jgi:hypothetical protein
VQALVEQAARADAVRDCLLLPWAQRIATADR